MMDKLIEYGFAEWQIQKLLKYRVLDTSHGIYKLKNGKLYLNDKLIMEV